MSPRDGPDPTTPPGRRRSAAPSTRSASSAAAPRASARGRRRASSTASHRSGTKFGTPELDALFKKAAESGDEAVQDEAYRDAGRIINKAAPYDWLWAVAHTDAYTDKLTPIIHALARESFAQIEKWTLAP